jgi:hypothetical protein
VSDLAATDVPYLECVERKSFMPIGWLYERVFESLRERGLVEYTQQGGFILSDDGARQLKEWRAGPGSVGP